MPLLQPLQTGLRLAGIQGKKALIKTFDHYIRFDTRNIRRVLLGATGQDKGCNKKKEGIFFHGKRNETGFILLFGRS